MIDRWHNKVFENGVVNDPVPLMIDEITQLREIYKYARRMVLSEDQTEFEAAYILLNREVSRHE